MNADKPILTPILAAPMWFYVVVACCLVWIAIFVSIALTPGPQWVVVEYESRGPNRYSRVLLDQSTGRTCEVIGRPLDGVIDELNRLFWVCNAQPEPSALWVPSSSIDLSSDP